MSDFSLAQISSISVIALPLIRSDIKNPRHYSFGAEEHSAVRAVPSDDGVDRVARGLELFRLPEPMLPLETSEWAYKPPATNHQKKTKNPTSLMSEPVLDTTRRNQIEAVIENRTWAADRSAIIETDGPSQTEADIETPDMTSIDSVLDAKHQQQEPDLPTKRDESEVGGSTIRLPISTNPVRGLEARFRAYFDSLHTEDSQASLTTVRLALP
jgi:hypothetical protein